jgi:hypothetical protein
MHEDATLVCVPSFNYLLFAIISVCHAYWNRYARGLGLAAWCMGDLIVAEPRSQATAAWLAHCDLPHWDK